MDRCEGIGLHLSEFDYDLPQDRIAQRPLPERDQSRLLVMSRKTGAILAERRFADLGGFLNPGDLLVLNETRVNAMRLHGTLAGGGRAELFLTHRVSEGLWQALARPGKRLLPGATVMLEDGLTAEVVASMDERGQRLVQFSRHGNLEGVEAILEKQGMTPLPPYIAADSARETDVRERYQTVYARQEGSAAAPTAGLHFTDTLIARLREQGILFARVTLHVGVGTFRPIITDNIEEHTMHSEKMAVSEDAAAAIRDAKGRIVAVGTTSLRALESAAIAPRRVRSGEFETSLYVRPGYTFQVADSLITNFHMPRSTLLVLVAAFMGREAMLAAYAHALASDYRFLSFGDAMAILSSNSLSDHFPEIAVSPHEGTRGEDVLEPSRLV